MLLASTMVWPDHRLFVSGPLYSDAACLMIRAADKGLSGIHAAVHTEPLSYREIDDIAYRTFDNGGEIEIALEKPPSRSLITPNGMETLAMLDMPPLITMCKGISEIRTAGMAGVFGPMDVN